MTLDQRLALARELIARRDEIDAQLEALFEGRALAVRRPSRKSGAVRGEIEPSSEPEAGALGSTAHTELEA